VPISIVVGGQYGSEGKGKVAHYVARTSNARAAVRVGGPNSGHTVYSDSGEKYIFQHLPTAAILPDVTCVMATGSYLDVSRLLNEVALIGLPESRLKVDPHAVVITAQDCVDEHLVGLRAGIGSTLTGTGAAVMNRISRTRPIRFAKDEPSLRPYLADTKEVLHRMLEVGERVVIEGTQGYGLSLLHSPHYPYATSRDTTAAGFLSEVGLSPMDVDDIVMVLRAFPIRVPGNSGPLANEITWEAVTSESGSHEPIVEITSVTKSVRRVASFDPFIVKAALRANKPTRLILNHADYFDKTNKVKAGTLTAKMYKSVEAIELQMGRSIDCIGTSPVDVVSNSSLHISRRA
jgi:adenylosuccinate synthase